MVHKRENLIGKDVIVEGKRYHVTGKAQNTAEVEAYLVGTRHGHRVKYILHTSFCKLA